MNRSKLALSVLAIVASCADPVDKAAKKRIFSPEDPPKVVASAAENLEPAKLADNAELARRVLRMGAAEATERVGPHRFSATVAFIWTGGGRTEELKENRVLVAGRGGVAGDFHASLNNSRDQGLEVIRIHNAVFARSRYGKFRQRLRDRGMAEKEREEVYGALRDFDSIFDGRLKLVLSAKGSVRGRPAIKYAVTLAPAEKKGASTAKAILPPIVGPKGGFDEATSRRIASFEKRELNSVQGELAVDSQTAVVLESHLEGKLSVLSPDKGATLRLKVDTGLADIGSDPGIKPPSEFLPDADKPAGIASALERFGIPHGAGPGRDAGVEPEAGEEEPDR